MNRIGQGESPTSGGDRSRIAHFGAHGDDVGHGKSCFEECEEKLISCSIDCDAKTPEFKNGQRSVDVWPTSGAPNKRAMDANARRATEDQRSVLRSRPDPMQWVEWTPSGVRRW